MTVVITFELTGADFEDAADAMIAHCCRQATDKIQHQLRMVQATHCTALESVHKILDVNGNTVGTVLVQEKVCSS